MVGLELNRKGAAPLKVPLARREHSGYGMHGCGCHSHSHPKEKDLTVTVGVAPTVSSEDDCGCDIHSGGATWTEYRWPM